MTTLAPANADTLLTRLRAAPPLPAAAAKPSAEIGRPALGPAASVTLSDAARAMLRAADAGKTAASAVTETFDERVQARTDALASRLSTAFAAEGIPIDDAIALRLDAGGRVVTDSPYKKKIEEIFQNDPDLAREFEDVATLNTMRAAQKALNASRPRRPRRATTTRGARRSRATRPVR